MLKSKTTASKLDRRIELLQYSEEQSASGEVVTTWKATCTISARAEFPKTGNTEDFLADAQTSVTRCIFTVRRRELDAKMKVKFDGHEWDIISVSPDESRRYTVINCKRYGDG